MPFGFERRAKRSIALVGAGDDGQLLGALHAGDLEPAGSDAAAPLQRRPHRQHRAARLRRHRAAARDDRAPSRRSSENTPARQAATYSPTLWPIIASRLRRRRLSSQRGERVRRSRTAPAARSASRPAAAATCASPVARRRATRRRSTAEVPASDRRGTLERLAERRRLVRTARRAMPGCCEPWPGNRNTTRGAAPRVATALRSTLAARRPRRRRSRGDDDRRAARSGLRPRISVRATSASGERRMALRDVGAARVRASQRALGACAPTAAARCDASRAIGASRRGVARRRFLEDDVGVGAADAEGAHRRRGAALSPRGQGVRCALTRNGVRGEVDLRVRPREVQRGRDDLALAAPARP